MPERFKVLTPKKKQAFVPQLLAIVCVVSSTEATFPLRKNELREDVGRVRYFLSNLRISKSFFYVFYNFFAFYLENGRGFHTTLGTCRYS